MIVPRPCVVLQMEDVMFHHVAAGRYNGCHVHMIPQTTRAAVARMRIMSGRSKNCWW